MFFYRSCAQCYKLIKTFFWFLVVVFSIINFFFVASVCIVLEICEFGSLSDVLRGHTGGGINRASLKLSLSDRMFLAYGCAKGLEALHSYSPDLCHRDIKSFNYLSKYHSFQTN